MAVERSGQTVLDRVQTVQSDLSPTEVGTGLAVGLSLVFLLLVVQEPLVHDAMHNFRHAAGITCH